MPVSSSSAQKAALQEFTGVTQLDKSNATKILKSCNWNVQEAINSYFNSGAGGGKASSSCAAALNKLFDQYRDNPTDEPDEINVEGVGNMLGEMEIGLDDIGALVFSELVQSPTLGKVTRDGFVGRLDAAGVDSLPKLRTLILQRRATLSTEPQDVFKPVYNHTFALALQGGQKALPPEIAAEFWRMLFTEPGWEWRSEHTPWLDWWLEFTLEMWRRAVNKDLWRQTLTFALETKKDDTLGFWNEESSWPSVIDEFVEWVRTRKRPVASGGGGGDGEAMEVE